MQTTEKRDCNSKIFQLLRVPANSSATSFQAGNGRERESADVQDRRYEDGGEECREKSAYCPAAGGESNPGRRDTAGEARRIQEVIAGRCPGRRFWAGLLA